LTRLRHENRSGKSNQNQDLTKAKRCDFSLLPEEIETVYRRIKSELLDISSTIVKAVYLFYSLEDGSLKIMDFIGEKINELLISGDLFSFLQKLKKCSMNNTLRKYKEKFIRFLNIHPRDLGISPYFSFDKQFKNSLGNIEGATTGETPFVKSIILLSELKFVSSISQKLQLLSSLRNTIIDEIDQFWIDTSVDQSKLMIDADNFLSIFIYLLIKNQLSDLVVDIEIMDDFTNNSFKLSRKGYIFSLVRSSLDFVLNVLEPSLVDQNIKEYCDTINKDLYSLKGNNCKE